MLRKTVRPLLFSLCFPLASACLTHKQESIEEPSGEVEDIGAADVLPEVDPSEIDESIDQELAETNQMAPPEIGAEEDEINRVLKNGIPVEINEKVEEWIHYFTKRSPEAFQRFMDRGEPYKKMIVSTLRDHGIPSEVYYLAMIESGFVINAKSTASAVGFWQFIPATGRRYGLRVDKFVDERRDPWRATVAASMYLSDLNNVFDSWYLAMAAYNAGEMRIMNAIMRGKSRDFWTLVKGRQLPSETMDYIPKVLAAFIVGTNPEKYGFRRPAAEAHAPVSLVAVPSPISLAKVAEVTNIPLESLQRFNPHLKTGITPPGTSSYKIWVPRPEKDRIAGMQGELQAHRLPMREVSSAVASQDSGPSQAAPKKKFHRVRRGENLATIAQNYGLSVTELMQLNNLHSSRLYAGRKLRVQAEQGTEAQAAPEARKSQAKISTVAARKAAALASLRGESNELSNEARDSTYRVQRGDNLEAISKRFNVPVHELKKINKLRRSRIHVGQVLIVNREGSDQG